MSELNDKQQRFCEEYVKDLNATQAAIRAGYSEKTAKEQASRLLTNVNIEAEVNRLQRKVSKKVELDAAWVLRRLKKVYKRSVEQGVYQASNKSLELIGKHLAMFSENIRHADANGNLLAPLTINMTLQEASQAYIEKIKND